MPQRKNANLVFFTDERLFGFWGIMLGVILIIPAAIGLFAESLKFGGYVVVSVFSMLGITAIFARARLSYDRESRNLLVRMSLFGLGFTKKYSIDNYRSMGDGYLDGGPDYGSHDSMVTHFVHYTFILYGKKGVKDLALYSASGSRCGFFPAEKRFRKVADKLLRHLPLKQERYGP